MRDIGLDGRCVILGVVIVSWIGFVQEGKAEMLLNSLSSDLTAGRHASGGKGWRRAAIRFTLLEGSRQA